MNDNHDHHFEPIYHPEVASSDGRRRTWHSVGKSVILEVESKPEGNRDQQHESGHGKKKTKQELRSMHSRKGEVKLTLRKQ